MLGFSTRALKQMLLNHSRCEYTLISFQNCVFSKCEYGSREVVYNVGRKLPLAERSSRFCVVEMSSAGEREAYSSRVPQSMVPTSHSPKCPLDFVTLLKCKLTGMCAAWWTSSLLQVLMEILLFFSGAWEKCLLVAIPRNCIYRCDHVIGSLVKQEGFSEVIPSH